MYTTSSRSHHYPKRTPIDIRSRETNHRKQRTLSHLLEGDLLIIFMRSPKGKSITNEIKQILVILAVPKWISIVRSPLPRSSCCCLSFQKYLLHHELGISQCKCQEYPIFRGIRGNLNHLSSTPIPLRHQDT